MSRAGFHGLRQHGVPGAVRRLAAVIGIMPVIAAAVLMPGISRAGSCSIESQGPAIYAAVQQRLTEQHGAPSGAIFPGYQEVHRSVKDGCVLWMEGGYIVPKKHDGVRRFTAEVKADPAAAAGWTIAQLHWHH